MVEAQKAEETPRCFTLVMGCCSSGSCCLKEGSCGCGDACECGPDANCKKTDVRRRPDIDRGFGKQMMAGAVAALVAAAGIAMWMQQHKQ